MKKLLSILGTFGLVTLSTASIVACSPGTNPSGGNGNGGGSGTGEENNSCKVVELPDFNLKEEEYYKFNVMGTSKSEWSCIEEEYSKEAEKNKKFRDDAQIELDKAEPGSLEEQLNKILVKMSDSFYRWYQTVAYEAQYYLYLYDNNVEVSYNDQTMENIILSITDKWTLNEISKKTNNIYNQIYIFKSSQESYWQYIKEENEKNPPTAPGAEEMFQKEEEQWNYLIKQVIDPKLKKYEDLSNKIDKKIENLG